MMGRGGALLEMGGVTPGMKGMSGGREMPCGLASGEALAKVVRRDSKMRLEGIFGE